MHIKKLNNYLVLFETDITLSSLTLRGCPGVRADPLVSICVLFFAAFIVLGLFIFLISYLMYVNKILK